MCTSGCETAFARCSKIPPGQCEREQFINFDNCCTNTNGCCNGFPINWPPRPDLKPLMVCRDCGCKYEMYQYMDDCFPPAPDFSDIRKHGYQIQIGHPNACNEIHFNFTPNRCIPPRVCCSCPLCKRKHRPGDHFCDCSCRMCESRRAHCLNRLRRKLLAEHRKPCASCGKKHLDIPPCCVPLPTDEFEGKEKEVPRGVQLPCPCHIYTPSNWEVQGRCPLRLHYEGEVIRLEKEAEEKAREELVELRTGIWAVLTDSLSQLKWDLGPPPCVPCPDVEQDESCQDPCANDCKNDDSVGAEGESEEHDDKDEFEDENEGDEGSFSSGESKISDDSLIDADDHGQDDTVGDDAD